MASFAVMLAACSGGDGGVVTFTDDERLSKFDLPEGTIYPSLYRLERKGFVSSIWKSVDGRRRRFYSLTRSGTRELERQRADWQSFSRAMEAFVA